MYTLLKFIKGRWGVPQLFCLTIAIWSNQAIAFDDFESFQVHGFINQGYFLSSDNNVYGNSSSNNGSLELTEIGLNGSIRPLSNLAIAVQGIYRRAGEVSDEARIDYALIDWTIVDHDNYQYGIRLGRVKNPFGFFNDTRDVAFTRPSIFLPQGIYQERSRNLFLSSNGGQFYLNTTTSIGEFSLQINAGQLRDDVKEVEIAILNSDAPGHIDVKPAYMGKLEFESSNGATRLAFSYANIEMDYKPGAGDFFADGDLSFELLIFSAQQSFGDLTFTGEYLRQHNVFENLGIFYPDYKPTSEHYYIQGDYQFNSQFQGMLRYDASYLNKDDKDGNLSASLTGNPNYAAYTKDYMVGMRWTPNRSWMIQAEYHRVNGTSNLSFSDNTDRSAIEQHWDLLALQLSYRF
jgi:hypothetical protein